jgi:hypothetical protein
MARWGRWLGAACLVLSSLLFSVFAGTGGHPGPSGTTQDQIRLVAEAIAGLGWSKVDPLTWAGGPLATGLLLLGLVGGLLRSLRVWEAALLVLAAIGLLFTIPGCMLRLLNRLTIGWNAVEGIVAVAAGPVSLVGFAWTPASRSPPPSSWPSDWPRSAAGLQGCRCDTGYAVILIPPGATAPNQIALHRTSAQPDLSRPR